MCTESAQLLGSPRAAAWGELARQRLRGETMKDNDLMLARARELRREMTPHERKLWYLFLRKYPVKFYKQKIMERYIVDFYCAPAKLVIELDGSQHYENAGKESDHVRDERLNELGFQVLRFSNREIDREFDAVCDLIDRTVKERL